MIRRVAFVCTIVFASPFFSVGEAANVQWNVAGTSAYLTASNWSPATVPTAADVAQFGASPTGVVINLNFGATTNAGTQVNGQRIEDVGAVELLSSRPAGITIGNSSQTAGADGKYRFKGAAVNGVNDVILRNNSNQLLTIQNATGGGTQTMSVLLGDATNNIVNIDGSGGITINVPIADDGAAKRLTLGGSGTGSLTLGGTNTYSGGTTISQGTAVWNVSGALGTGSVTMNDANTGSSATALYKNAAGTLARDITVANAGTGTTTIGSNTGASGDTVTYSGTVTLNKSATFKSGAAALVVFSGAVHGTGGVTIATAASGTGTVQLSNNANDYSGDTTVSSGTLLVTNTSGSATGTGAVAVNAGTLAGNGVVTGAVTVASGANLSPGTPTTSIAALGTGALTLKGGSTFVVDMNSAASLSAAADLVNANGALNIDPTGALLSITDPGNTPLSPGTKFTLISYSGTWNGNTFDTHPNLSTISLGGNNYVLTYDDTSAGSSNFGGYYTNAVTLTIAAVPEAGSLILGALVCTVVGVAAGGKRYLRRAKA